MTNNQNNVPITGGDTHRAGEREKLIAHPPFVRYHCIFISAARHMGGSWLVCLYIRANVARPLITCIQRATSFNLQRLSSSYRTSNMSLEFLTPYDCSALAGKTYRTRVSSVIRLVVWNPLSNFLQKQARFQDRNSRWLLSFRISDIFPADLDRFIWAKDACWFSIMRVVCAERCLAAFFGTTSRGRCWSSGHWRSSSYIWRAGGIFCPACASGRHLNSDKSTWHNRLGQKPKANCKILKRGKFVCIYWKDRPHVAPDILDMYNTLRHKKKR